MDSSSLGGGFLSVSGGGLLDLESSMHRHQQTHLAHSSTSHRQPMNLMTGLESSSQHIGLMEVGGLMARGVPTTFSKGKAAVGALNADNISEEDEPSLDDGNGESLGKGKKGSPWHRMKWTDEVVRLLIAVVAYVGDDGAAEEGFRRKSGILQKKGKWKTVSKIMISRDCHVSPQQCEDKFNDLNKRYKRLNDILGRGTSCRVVEDPVLMDSMPQLSAKAKEDVRKILSSKHLFYKEMCAYHNGQKIPNCQDLDLQRIHCVSRGDQRTRMHQMRKLKTMRIVMTKTTMTDWMMRMTMVLTDAGEKCVDLIRGKWLRRTALHGRQGSRQEGLQFEMADIFQDPSRTSWERKDWIKRQMLQLQEQRVSIQVQSFELEKQRFKWLRYCSNKNRELERMRLENESMKLENERGLLELKHKELEINSRRSEASFDPTSHGIDRFQGRDHLDLSRYQ
ncbi:hypothetical protein NL676_004428 [Syzygium grande]|nr:hypothetical protein NL676_004428 [Syzygium grande]